MLGEINTQKMTDQQAVICTADCSLSRALVRVTKAKCIGVYRRPVKMMRLNMAR